MRKEKKRAEDRGQNSEVEMRNAERKKEDRGQRTEFGSGNAEVEKWRVANVNTNEKIADSGLKKL
jgi:hypothetical protein